MLFLEPRLLRGLLLILPRAFGLVLRAQRLEFALRALRGRARRLVALAELLPPLRGARLMLRALSFDALVASTQLRLELGDPLAALAELRIPLRELPCTPVELLLALLQPLLGHLASCTQLRVIGYGAVCRF